MDTIITKTNTALNASHVWRENFESSLWLWGGSLSHNLQFRTDYFMNFFNKVLLNTIQESQIFCFIPLIQYHSKTRAAATDTEGFTHNDVFDVNRNGQLPNGQGYFPRNLGILILSAHIVCFDIVNKINMFIKFSKIVYITFFTPFQTIRLILNSCPSTYTTIKEWIQDGYLV